MSNIPDLQQRQSALDITQSFLVQAPAGSGKTELLTQRFLKLLTYVETPEEIVAITFTNKAAAEMRTRIIEALEKAETQAMPTNAHEKLSYELAKAVLTHSTQKNWHLREHPNRLRLLTMDALSLQIAQKLPISSKLGAQCDIAQDPSILYQQAVKTILLSSPESTPWLEEIKTLLLYLDNNYSRLESLLVNLLAKRDQWLPLIMLGNQTADKKEILENELNHINQYYLEMGEKLLSSVLKQEIIALVNYAKSNLAIPESHNNKEFWLFVADLFLTQNDQLRKKADKNIGFPASSSANTNAEKLVYEAYKQRYQSMINSLEQENNFIHWLIDCRKLPNENYTETQWQVLSALLTLLPLTTAQLRLVFAQHNQVDYIENAQSALVALGNADQPTDIALQLDYKIQHLLVDEFQDTSRAQFQLLEKLTYGWMPDDGRTLFLVGDPMQSIYRFRQAEVGLFLHAKHRGIGDVVLNFISLNSNFRSSAQIVQWINDNFTAIFPKTEEMQLGAIPYSFSHAIHEETNNNHSQTDCFYFPKSNSNHLLEENYIVEKIKSIKKDFPNETIAILIRSRDHLKTITPLLQAKQIAYQAIDIDALSHKSIIHDLLSLTRACIHLSDKVAWLACLRAPWCGLSLQDIWILAQDSCDKILWEHLNNPIIINRLSEEGKIRTAHFLQAITFAVQQRQRIPLRDLIETTWKKLGGEQVLKNPNEKNDINQFFTVLENITDKNGVIKFDLLENQVQKLFAATSISANNPIQIMTIHKSKGLEFDHVFLPKLHKKTASLDKPLITWLEYPDDNNIYHLLMAPISEVNRSDKTYDYIQQQQQQKLLLEMDRVLYVATTRAKKCLYLTASLELDESHQPTSPSNTSLLGRIWRARPNIFELYNNELTNKNTVNTNEIEPILAKQLHRVSLSFIKNITQKLSKDFAYSAIQKNCPKLALSPYRTDAKLGSIIHLLIEQITKNTLTWWQAIDKKSQEKIILALCRQFNLPSDIYTKSIEKIQLAINNLIQDPKGQWIIENHPLSLSEYLICDYHHEKWNKKIIDRFFKDKNGEYWIVDYKISDKPPEQAALEYKKQLQSYQHALSQLTGEKNIHIALYFPLSAIWYVY